MTYCVGTSIRVVIIAEKSRFVVIKIGKLLKRLRSIQYTAVRRHERDKFI